ncbi:MAG: copper chaperone PCu(A)C [Gammaproteobacteria bacterium]|nr:copper chaperone PCu(A)C [Gammaproteobacteria bacterium]
MMLLCLTAAAARATAPLSVTGAWIRLLPGGLPAGGYFTLRNDGDHPVKLIGAKSPAYGSVMLHRSLQSQGESGMVGVDTLTVPAHGQIRFAPGGYHLMLMQPRAPLEVGGAVTVALEFDGGVTLEQIFVLRPASATGP